MRAILFILILVIVAVLVAIWTGFLNIDQVRPARAPNVDVSSSGVTAANGQAPTFDIETGSVAVGTRSTNVTVPTVKVVPPDGGAEDQANQVTGNASTPAG